MKTIELTSVFIGPSVSAGREEARSYLHNRKYWHLFNTAVLLICFCAAPDGNAEEPHGRSAFYGQQLDRGSNLSASLDLKKLAVQMQEVNKKFPPPEFPKKAAQFRVDKVQNDGTIILIGAPPIILANTKCSTEGLNHWRSMFSISSIRVVYTPLSSISLNPIQAEIWVVDNELSAKQVGPSYSLLVDTSLTNGWCVSAKLSDSSDRALRNEALMQISRELGRR